MLTDLLVDIAELFEGLASRVYVTAGQPPSAAGDDCPPTFYVWGGAIYHSAIPTQRTVDPGCFYRRTYDISWRLDVCYPVRADGRDLTSAEWLEVSETLYGLTDQAWCALTAAASDGSLFQTIGTCEDITIGEAIFSDPQGGLVSAQGSIQVTHPCPPVGS